MNSTMTPIDWAKRPLQKYADFTGRAPRAEFWWYCLFVIIAAIVTMIIDSTLGLPKMLGMYGPLTLILMLGTFVPTLAVQMRRLHDRNQPGWWLAALYAPYALMLIMTPGLVRGTQAGAPNLGSMAIGGLLALVVLGIAITLLVFYCLPGTAGDNKYGPNPYGGEAGRSVPAE
jgi:uncharacterized membrane protein YhaH (DUF805 family)